MGQLNKPLRPINNCGIRSIWSDQSCDIKSSSVRWLYSICISSESTVVMEPSQAPSPAIWQFSLPGGSVAPLSLLHSSQLCLILRSVISYNQQILWRTFACCNSSGFCTPCNWLFCCCSAHICIWSSPIRRSLRSRYARCAFLFWARRRYEIHQPLTHTAYSK